MEVLQNAEHTPSEASVHRKKKRRNKKNPETSAEINTIISSTVTDDSIEASENYVRKKKRKKKQYLDADKFESVDALIETALMPDSIMHCKNKEEKKAKENYNIKDTCEELDFTTSKINVNVSQRKKEKHYIQDEFEDTDVSNKNSMYQSRNPMGAFISKFTSYRKNMKQMTKTDENADKDLDNAISFATEALDLPDDCDDRSIGKKEKYSISAEFENADTLIQKDEIEQLGIANSSDTTNHAENFENHKDNRKKKRKKDKHFINDEFKNTDVPIEDQLQNSLNPIPVSEHSVSRKKKQQIEIREHELEAADKDLDNTVDLSDYNNRTNDRKKGRVTKYSEFPVSDEIRNDTTFIENSMELENTFDTTLMFKSKTHRKKKQAKRNKNELETAEKDLDNTIISCTTEALDLPDSDYRSNGKKKNKKNSISAEFENADTLIQKDEIEQLGIANSSDTTNHAENFENHKDNRKKKRKKDKHFINDEFKNTDVPIEDQLQNSLNPIPVSEHSVSRKKKQQIEIREHELEATDKDLDNTVDLSEDYNNRTNDRKKGRVTKYSEFPVSDEIRNDTTFIENSMELENTFDTTLMFKSKTHRKKKQAKRNKNELETAEKDLDNTIISCTTEALDLPDSDYRSNGKKKNKKNSISAEFENADTLIQKDEIEQLGIANSSDTTNHAENFENHKDNRKKKRKKDKHFINDEFKNTDVPIEDQLENSLNPIPVSEHSVSRKKKQQIEIREHELEATDKDLDNTVDLSDYNNRTNDRKKGRVTKYSEFPVSDEIRNDTTFIENSMELENTFDTTLMFKSKTHRKKKQAKRNKNELETAEKDLDNTIISCTTEALDLPDSDYRSNGKKKNKKNSISAEFENADTLIQKDEIEQLGIANSSDTTNHAENFENHKDNRKKKRKKDKHFINDEFKNTDVPIEDQLENSLNPIPVSEHSVSRKKKQQIEIREHELEATDKDLDNTVDLSDYNNRTNDRKKGRVTKYSEFPVSDEIRNDTTFIENSMELENTFDTTLMFKSKTHRKKKQAKRNKNELETAEKDLDNTIISCTTEALDLPDSDYRSNGKKKNKKNSISAEFENADTLIQKDEIEQLGIANSSDTTNHAENFENHKDNRKKKRKKDKHFINDEFKNTDVPIEDQLENSLNPIPVSEHSVSRKKKQQIEIREHELEATDKDLDNTVDLSDYNNRTNDRKKGRVTKYSEFPVSDEIRNDTTFIENSMKLENTFDTTLMFKSKRHKKKDADEKLHIPELRTEDDFSEECRFYKEMKRKLYKCSTPNPNKNIDSFSQYPPQLSKTLPDISSITIPGKSKKKFLDGENDDTQGSMHHKLVTSSSHDTIYLSSDDNNRVNKKKKIKHEQHKTIDKNTSEIQKAAADCNSVNVPSEFFVPVLDDDEDPVDFTIPMLHESESVSPMSKEQKASFESKGIAIKLGKWLQSEDAVLQRNYNQFCGQFKINDPYVLLGVGQSQRNAEVMRFIKAKHFYVRLGKDLASRPLHSIYLRARTLFHPLRKNKKCTKDDISTVKEACNRLGNKWCRIGGMLDKKASLVRECHRWNQKPVNKGTWTHEEEENLITAIKSVAKTSEISAKQIKSISWEAVAKLVPTRNFSQCRLHWGEYMAWDPDVTERSIWSQRNDQELIEIIKNEHLRDETEIDWEDIHKSFKEVAPSYMFLQKRWRQLKRSGNHFILIKGLFAK